jgi:hypothetical protein
MMYEEGCMRAKCNVPTGMSVRLGHEGFALVDLNDEVRYAVMKPRDTRDTRGCDKAHPSKQ